MKYAVDEGSGTTLYIPTFIKIGSGIQKLIGGHTDTNTEDGDRLSRLLYPQKKGSRLKADCACA
jgi:hypothetical protein